MFFNDIHKSKHVRDSALILIALESVSSVVSWSPLSKSVVSSKDTTMSRVLFATEPSPPSAHKCENS